VTARLIYKCRLVGLFHIMLLNNGHISEIYFYRPSYLLQKSVDMLLHVTAGKLINMCRVQTTIHTGLL
jgi:hypothetical protein